MKTTLSILVPSLLSQMEDAPIFPQMPGDATVTAAHYITLSALVLPAYRCAELLPPGRSTL
jgi:hypothetical protein